MIRNLIICVLLIFLIGCTGMAQRGAMLRTHSGIEKEKLSNLEASTGEKIIVPPTWAFPDVIESARKINSHNLEGRLFDKNGLAYSPKELEKLQVATMSPGDLQKYADIVTHAYPDAVFRQFPTSCKEISLEQMNTTSIAGIAYVSLNAVGLETRERAANCLKEIQNRLKEEDTTK